MNPLKKTALSMLDLVSLREGGTVAQALATALRTAQHAEALGFTRLFLAQLAAERGLSYAFASHFAPA
jgi:hypothetical protein